MPQVFLATLGQRPESITMALDVMLSRHTIDAVGIIHTQPDHPLIESAYQAMQRVLIRDYSHIPRHRFHEVTFGSGAPLIDIVDQYSADEYFRAVVTILQGYKADAWQMDFLVSGGRKAMSIYATLAASTVFDVADHIWTIIADPQVMQPHRYHVSSGQYGAVQLVSLPFLAHHIRQHPISLDNMLTQARNAFLSELTKQERQVVNLLWTYPKYTNGQLGDLLKKSEKTVENQLRSAYVKLEKYITLDGAPNRKRQRLIDLLLGRMT